MGIVSSQFQFNVEALIQNLKGVWNIWTQPLIIPPQLTVLNIQKDIRTGVTFHPAPHNEIRPFDDATGTVASGINPSAEILEHLRPQARTEVVEILQSSIEPRVGWSVFPSKPTIATSFRPQRNGLVHTIIEAYNQHHALVLRPDDVWIAILAQISLFVDGSGCTEELRSKFVPHFGFRELVVKGVRTRSRIDPGKLAGRMTDLIHENVVDPSLQTWILPNFSTTTTNDVVAASVVMMARRKPYFKSLYTLCCGIPRVTLLGERTDWENLLQRIERLKEYGAETKAWYRMLQPVLRRFVLAFDEGYAESEENRDFWQRVVHYWDEGSGVASISGWIAAFCVFDNNGRWIGGGLVRSCWLWSSLFYRTLSFSPSLQSQAEREVTPGVISFLEVVECGMPTGEALLSIDNVEYHSLLTNDIPTGQLEVPIKLIRNNQQLNCVVLAGLVGMSVGDSNVSGGKNDQLSPVVGWWMFTV
jgi:hypothetical protein